jgi:hypothetical protein
MTQGLKDILLCAVLITLFALGESLGLPLLSMPGFLVVRSFTPLPSPYPTAIDAEAPHRIAVAVVSDLFWASLICAWIVLARSRQRRAVLR